MKLLSALSHVIVALTLVACRDQGRPVAATDAGSTASTCTDPVVAHAFIDGSYTGDATSESVGRPSLVVALDVRHSPYPLRDPSVKRVALPLAPPRFALPFAPNDLCSMHPIQSGAVFSCIGDDGQVRRLEIRTDDKKAQVARDGAIVASEALPPGRECMDVDTPVIEQDIEPLRAAFNRDAPSARCAGKPSGPPLAGFVALRTIPAHDPRALERPEGMTCDPRKELTLTIPGAGLALALGTIDNVCGGCSAQQGGKAGTLTVSCSDMGTEYRQFYQLGDGLFVNDGSKFRRIDLPCGRKLALTARGRDFTVSDGAHD